MKHCLIWRRNVPCIVSYLAGYELDCEEYPSIMEALLALALLKGF